MYHSYLRNIFIYNDMNTSTAKYQLIGECRKSIGAMRTETKSLSIFFLELLFVFPWTAVFRLSRTKMFSLESCVIFYGRIGPMNYGLWLTDSEEDESKNSTPNLLSLKVLHSAEKKIAMPRGISYQMFKTNICAVEWQKYNDIVESCS